MKRFAAGEEPHVVVPLIVVVVDFQVALDSIVIEAGDDDVSIRIAHAGAQHMYKVSSTTPSVECSSD